MSAARMVPQFKTLANTGSVAGAFGQTQGYKNFSNQVGNFAQQKIGEPIRQFASNAYDTVQPRTNAQFGAAPINYLSTRLKQVTTIPEQRGGLDNLVRTGSNFSQNFLNTIGSGVQDIGSVADTRDLRTPFRVVRGVGKVAAPFVPSSGALYQATNLLSSVDNPLDKNDRVRRFTSGVLQGISQTDTVGQNVPKRETKFELPIVGEVAVDPFNTVGNMIGFVKNPVNQKLFKLTESVFPTASTGVASWLASNAIRGSLEQVILSIPDAPDSMSNQEKAKWVMSQVGQGAISEIVGQAFFQGIGKGASVLSNTKAVNKLASTFDEIVQSVKTTTPEKVAELTRAYTDTLDRRIVYQDSTGAIKKTPILTKEVQGGWDQHLRDQGYTIKGIEIVGGSRGAIGEPPKPPTDPTEALKVEDSKWITPIKGEPKGKIPNVKDVNGIQVKEGDVIEFDGLLGGQGKSVIRWQEPHIAKASGKRIDGQWIGNGALTENNKIPFRIVQRADGTNLNQSQLPKSDPTEALGGNKIPVKRDLTQQVAENITGKKIKVKPTQTVESPPIAPIPEPAIVKSNTRAKQAGVPTREAVRASLPDKLDSFIQDTLGYTTQAPTGGAREAGAYTKALRTGQAKITSAVEGALGSENPLIRNAASTMQGFFRGLGMSPERAAQSAELRGGMAVSTQRGYDVMESLYQTLGTDQKTISNSRTRINAVLDPEISKTKVKLSDLTPNELAVYKLVRKGLDYVHDTNYANGFISEKTYKSNLGKYTPRRYTTFEMPPEINAFTRQTKKIDTSAYKKRKALDAWKVENSVNDPIYALGRALTQTETNVAIKKYTDFLASQPGLITDNPRPGFTKLSDSPAYGALSGKYVLNSAAEDLKGFFYANEALQHVYDAFRVYDRLAPRQLQKKLLTVFNPTTNVGNIVSDQVFGWGTGVDPLTLNKNLYQIMKSPEKYKQLSDYLMRKGIVGTDITRTDFVDKFSSIDDLAKSVDKPKSKIKTFGNKVQSFYGGTDDAYKVAALKSLLDKGFTLEEATRKVADGFQNYASVGKFYDTWAKTPLVGSPFIKFQGDLMRIVKNTAVNNPLGLVAFLGTLQAVSYLSSKISGETPEDYKTRTERFAAPMIPGLNIPLTWQTPIGEINVARYISPFYANNQTTDLSKMIPFVPNIDTSKDVATNIALNTNDPLLAPVVQTLVNRDFRGKPISDPNETKWSKSTLTPSEQNVNKAKFIGRAYLPPPANSVLDVGAAVQGKPNMYGSMQTPGQALARVGGVKITQFGPEQAQAQRLNDAYYAQKQYESNDTQIKAVTKDLLSGKIDQKTADARIANIQKAPNSSGSDLISKGITQLPSGSYATLIDGKLKEFDTPEEAQKGIDKYNFKQSGKNIQVIGDTVWRLSKDGSATSEPKIDYDTKMTTQKMENAKLDKDYKTWQELAFTQLQNYQTQMQDPTLDELERGDLQQKIDALIRSALKYQSYGGFTKPKKPPAPPKMQVAKFGKPSFKMKRDSSAKSKKIKVVSSKSIAPPKVSVSRFKVKKA